MLLGALADRGAAGDRDTAETLLAECHELADLLDPQIGPLPAWMALADAEHARATGAGDAVQRWATAVGRCDELSLVHHAADARYRLAQALLDHDRRDEAVAPLRAAAAVARNLGATPLERDVVDLARRARIDLGDQRPSDDGGDGLGLTPPRDRGAGVAGRGPFEPRDRRAAVHQPQDRLRARLQHPAQARGRQPRRGRRARPPTWPHQVAIGPDPTTPTTPLNRSVTACPQPRIGSDHRLVTGGITRRRDNACELNG